MDLAMKEKELNATKKPKKFKGIRFKSIKNEFMIGYTLAIIVLVTLLSTTGYLISKKHSSHR